MPLQPTVFRPIRSNDVQVRPFKAYKSYTVTSASFSGSGYRVHSGIHNIYGLNVGDDSYNYPINADGTNQHVAWRWLDHRYYRFPYDPARSHELTDRHVTEKFLFYSSSVLSVPYFEVGERIKPGTFTVTSSVAGIPIRLLDDSNGNLCDPLIDTGSFASSSRCFFYMGFNDEYRQFENNFGTIITGSVKYELANVTKQADAYGINISTGVTVTSSAQSGPSGLCATFYDPANDGRIRVPHDELFNRFNSCDRWTISLWVRSGEDTGVFIGKGIYKTEQYFDTGEQRLLTRAVVDTTWPDIALLGHTADITQRRIPFILGVTGSEDFYFGCSNGTTGSFITGSLDFSATDWVHVAVTRDNDFVNLYLNGNKVSSGSMPKESTANDYDIVIGDWLPTSTVARVTAIDEIRMYDYALSTSEIASLSNRHYLSGSLYQTNVAGNVFYRNGQVAVSSTLPKYNSGSGFFNTAFTASYRGTHTIYENEVLVRVPSDQFNYTLNPTATYRPGTDESNNDCNTTTAGAESNNPPGELYLTGFVSGTIVPYITTIGLYNDQQQLLAVGKLGTAIQKRSDVDMNFIIRWDY